MGSMLPPGRRSRSRERARERERERVIVHAGTWIDDDDHMTDAGDHLRLTARLARGALSHPRPALRALGAAEPVWRDGRRLHPTMQLLTILNERVGRDAAELDAVKMRREMAKLSALTSPVRIAVRAVDRQIPGPGGPLPLRIYRPLGALENLPAIVFAHGGGFVTGDLETHDPTCRLLADVARCVVVAVDYRLAPEHPFPAAIDDAVAAYRWVLDHTRELGVVPHAIGAMGDSAGATITAALCLEARRLGLSQPAAQCLVYPLTDLHMRAASYKTFAAGFGLTKRNMDWYRDQYAPDPTTWDDPRVSPLLADDHSGLAPALVVTAGFDPLRDDGEAYADKLRTAGVPVTYRCYDDMIHAFHGMLVHPDSAAAAAEVDAFVGQMLHEAATAGGSRPRR